jgi:hypothetical protein
MEYKLKVTAISGDIIMLQIVAEAMALREATAGGTPFHEPTFKGRLTGYIVLLLEEVRSGHLKVCNAFGGPLAVDPSIDATEHFGYATRYVKEPDWERLRREIHPIGKGIWDFSHIDLGPMEIDKDKPQIFWSAKLKMLNEWAEKRRGDSFSISDDGVGWFDERGYVEPAKQLDTDQQGASLKPKSDQVGMKPSDSWRDSARKIGMDIAKEHKHLSHNQIADKAHEKMIALKNAGKSGMTNRNGEVPRPGTIKRHALKGIKVGRP